MSEIAVTITEADVDASIARVIEHAESIWDEWAWQVENQTWLIKGYGSWDEMRTAVYTNLNNIAAPRAERPELIARFRNAGLTQRETADTLGIGQATVARHDEPTYAPRDKANIRMDIQPGPDEVVDAELIEDNPADFACEWHHPEDSACAWDCLGKPYTRETTDEDEEAHRAAAELGVDLHPRIPSVPPTPISPERQREAELNRGRADTCRAVSEAIRSLSGGEQYARIFMTDFHPHEAEHLHPGERLTGERIDQAVNFLTAIRKDIP